MSKFFRWSFALLVFAAWSCNSQNASQGANGTQPGVVISHKVIDSEVAKTVANLSISGMHCSGGCGGKIQQELAALNGVLKTNLDFVEERAINTVSVEFNPQLTSEKAMIDCVSQIADGRYAVKAVEVVKYNGLQSHGRGRDAGVSAYQFDKVLKILGLLQSLLRFAE